MNNAFVITFLASINVVLLFGVVMLFFAIPGAKKSSRSSAARK